MPSIQLAVRLLVSSEHPYLARSNRPVIDPPLARVADIEVNISPDIR